MVLPNGMKRKSAAFHNVLRVTRHRGSRGKYYTLVLGLSDEDLL